MAYRLNTTKSLTNNVRHIIGAQIDKAHKELSERTHCPATIHETRKCLKRIRAVLKLIRPGLKTDIYKAENARFREIGRNLSSSRDKHVLELTLIRLAAQQNGVSQRDLSIIRPLVKNVQDGNVHIAASVGADAKRQLEKAKRHYQSLQLSDDNLEVLREGLERSYRLARKSQRRAYRIGDDDAFHEWRKPVQLHWRHMSLFMRGWPDFFRARVELARSLSRCLGEDHDLSVLMSFVQALEGNTDLNNATARRVIKAARERQKTLRETAEPLGQILFQQSSKAHARHVYGIWRASEWQTDPTAGHHLQVKKKDRDTLLPPATTDATQTTKKLS